MCDSGEIEAVFKQITDDTRLFEEIINTYLTSHPNLTQTEIITDLLKHIEKIIRNEVDNNKKQLQEYDITSDTICKAVNYIPNSGNIGIKIKEQSNEISDSKRKIVRDEERLSDLLKDFSSTLLTEHQKEKSAGDEIRENLKNRRRKKRNFGRF